ncbi:hypothetical protein [Sorangium sp. So ce854]
MDHEILVDFFESRPSLAAALLADVLIVEVQLAIDPRKRFSWCRS